MNLKDIKEEDEVTKDKSEDKGSSAKRAPFAVWTVDDEDYKLHLRTQDIVILEDKLNSNPINVIMGNGLPSLKVILLIVHQATKQYQHGLKFDDIQNIFDKYCEEGGNQTQFMTDVVIPLFKCSGFFSGAQAKAMDQKIEEADELN